jgi:hypothetical protein
MMLAPPIALIAFWRATLQDLSMKLLNNSLNAWTLALASVCAAATGTPALAQDATFVISARENGFPTYNPIKGTKLNVANNLIFDRLVVQDADHSFHGHLASLVGSISRRHDLDLQAAPRRQVPRRRALQRQGHRMVVAQVQGQRKRLHDRGHRQGGGG